MSEADKKNSKYLKYKQQGQDKQIPVNKLGYSLLLGIFFFLFSWFIFWVWVQVQDNAI